MIEVRPSYFRTQFQRFSCENMLYQNGIGPTRAFTSLQMNTVSQKRILKFESVIQHTRYISILQFT